MIQQFFNRVSELDILDRFERSGGLFVLYGRRRIGKTELVKQFSRNKKSIYFLADERPDSENLKEMKKIMARFLNNSLFEKADIKEWPDLFEEFASMCPKKTIIIMDEFPYLISSNKAIPSIFQKIWDQVLSKKNISLILLGSSISMMENYVLDYKSPLYGRRSGQLKLEAMKFKHIREFLQNYNIEDLIRVYGITDGIPQYILKFERNKKFIENLKEHVFSKGEFLHQECEILLKEELREIGNYSMILKAISFGRNRFGEIVNFTGMDKTMVSKYLENLSKLHIIHKEFPVTESKEIRNAWYAFDDNYFNFWFRFVYPNKHLIEENRQDDIIELIKDDINQHTSFIFEKVCKEFLWNASLPLKFNKIGRWWHKDNEIDIVCLDENKKEAFFVECKWSVLKEPEARRILEQLKAKTSSVDWKRKRDYFGIIGKKIHGKNNLRKDRFIVFDLDDLEDYIKSK